MSTLIQQPRTLLLRSIVRAGSVAFLTAAIACGGDSTGPADITGTYILRTVNGRSLPAVVYQISTRMDEVTAGSITLNADGTYVTSMDVRYVILGREERTSGGISGTWTRSGSAIEMTGIPAVVSVSGNRLTRSEPLMTGAPGVFVYTK